MSLLETLSRELEELVARTSPAVVGVEHRRGRATGFVLADDGYVITNAHVVRRDAKDVRILMAGHQSVKAKVVGVDDLTDLSVLKVDTRRLKSLPLADSQSIRVGQLVVAIGDPLQFERSVSLGVVSALDRSLPRPGGGLFEGLIQTDAAINPGNSGGPLLNAQGEVVGINTAIVPFAQGIGFAIPAQTANWVAAVLIQRGQIRRPVLGIAARGEELLSEVADRVGQHRAVRVYNVGAETPAQAAGLREGDLLLSAQGTPVYCVDDLQRIMVLSDTHELHVDVLRKERRRVVTVRPQVVAEAA